MRGLRVPLSIASAAFVSFSIAQPTYASDRSLYTWGSSQFGQLGLGDDKDKNYPHLVKALAHTEPAQLLLGGYTSAVITHKGELYTFGKGQDGSLGHNDRSNESIPRLVEDLLGKRVVTVGLGPYHSAAVTDDGQLYTWGRNTKGQLGSADRKGDYAIPKLVKALESEFIVNVSCGENHTLAVTKDGKVYSFGYGRSAALGLGTKDDQVVPKLVSFDNDVEIKSAKAGNGYSLFLDSKGRVFSCGSSEYGRLGHGRGDLFEKVPKLIRGLQGEKIVQVSAGEYHAAALTEDGRVYTWGYGKDGQTGTGSIMNSDVPRLVNSLLDKKVVQVDCGGGHTGALTEEGVLYLWGRGRSGQLGRGDQLESVAAYRTEPLPVEFFRKNNLKVQKVSLGADHSAAITSS